MNMAIKTTRWDSAEHLQSDEDIQLYLDACMEEAVMTQHL